MTSQLGLITFDSVDAARLAGFWAAVFDWPVQHGASPAMAMVADPSGDTAHRLLFLAVPEAKQAKNRCHLDLRPTDGDVDREVARLEELGATTLYEKVEYGTRWRTMHDPDGNEFCIGGPAEE
ncbi:MAG TPA: VOC family protein [Mycobacteriales bacterium]|jgi:predicted enzyme related to lactoylglutathione lyase